jgi:hypothetical protein
VTHQYYELEDDVFIKGRWYLNGLFDGNGVELEARVLRYGNQIDAGPPLLLPRWNSLDLIETQSPLTISRQRMDDISKATMPIEFTFAGHDVPVVTKSVAQLMASICPSDIQRFPVMVEGSQQEYEIINVVSLLPCIDKARSDIELWWTTEDNRPDKIGDPKSIRKLVIDPHNAVGHHIFRPVGWKSILVVSDLLKDALLQESVRGVRFKSVN